MSVRTLSCPIPGNVNPLSPNGYIFSIRKLPELTYFCQQVNLPSIGIGVAEFNNPLVQIPIPGENLEFDTLRVEFLVDSKMENFKAVYQWLKGIGFPESNADYNTFAEDTELVRSEFDKMVSDATLVILDNNNNSAATVEFIDCFPISLESLQFVSNSDDVQFLVGSVMFKYSLYRFI